MTTTIFIALFVALISIPSFLAIHRTEISLTVGNHALGSTLKAIAFNTIFLCSSSLAIWQTYNAIVKQSIYVPRRGYPAIWINPGDDPIAFVLYLMFYGFTLGGGVGFVTKMLRPRKKV